MAPVPREMLPEARQAGFIQFYELVSGQAFQNLVNSKISEMVKPAKSHVERLIENRNGLFVIPDRTTYSIVFNELPKAKDTDPTKESFSLTIDRKNPLLPSHLTEEDLQKIERAASAFLQQAIAADDKKITTLQKNGIDIQTMSERLTPPPNESEEERDIRHAGVKTYLDVTMNQINRALIEAAAVKTLEETKAAVIGGFSTVVKPPDISILQGFGTPVPAAAQGAALAVVFPKQLPPPMPQAAQQAVLPPAKGSNNR